MRLRSGAAPPAGHSTESSTALLVSAGPAGADAATGRSVFIVLERWKRSRSRAPPLLRTPPPSSEERSDIGLLDGVELERSNCAKEVNERMPRPLQSKVITHHRS
jgi:hypothetical protein